MTDFSNRDLSPQVEDKGFQIGLDRERLADLLLHISNGLRDNSVIVNKVELGRKFMSEDFNPETISFQFYQLTKSNNHGL